MAPAFSGPMGHFSSESTTNSKSALGGGHSWRTTPSSSRSSSRSSSHSSSRSSSPPSWRRRPSSSSSNGSQCSWATSSNWRTSPLQQSGQIAAPPEYEGTQPGDVVFLPDQLPPHESIIHEMLGTHANQKPWGHPAVVTSKFVQDGKQCVRIRLCSSFGGQRVEAQRKPEHWDMFVLADNEEDIMPQGSTRLATLQTGSGKFHKRTYVNLGWKSEYPIEIKYLENWRQAVIKFDAISTQRIIDCNPY